MAQHLRHGGFAPEDAAKLLGLPVAIVEELTSEAEEARPKLCRGKACGVLPMCPYCVRLLEIHTQMRADAQGG